MMKILISLTILFSAFLISTGSVQAQENKFGVALVQYYSEKGFQDHAKWKEHLDWAKSLVGGGGYVKLLFPWIGEADAPVDTYRSVINEVYARDLNPIVRIQNGWASSNTNAEIGITGCWKRPPQNSGTTYSPNAGLYSEYAQVVATFIDSLPPPPQGKTMYVELWNEMNYESLEWCDDQGNPSTEPENYARFYLEVFNRVEALGKPNIKIVNGGLGRASPIPYLRRMIAALSVTLGQNPSNLQNLFKYYATHVYPPTSSDQSFINGIGNYETELAVLREFGIDTNAIKVLITEGGYIRGTGDSQVEDERQAKLSVELIKKLNEDPRIVTATPFSLDDHTDRTFYSIPSPLNSTLFVPTGSSTVDGKPTGARPVYDAIRNFRLGIVADVDLEACQDCEPGKPYPIGYAVAENQAVVNSLEEPLVYTRTFPVSIKYTFKESSPGTKVIFVKYFYSNGGSKIIQTSVRYRVQEVARVCTPGETLNACKQTACNVGQEYTNPNLQVLGEETSAPQIISGPTVSSTLFVANQASRISFSARGDANTDLIIAYLYKQGVEGSVATIGSTSASNNWQNDDPWPAVTAGNYTLRFIPTKGSVQGQNKDISIAVLSQSAAPTPTPAPQGAPAPTPAPISTPPPGSPQISGTASLSTTTFAANQPARAGFSATGNSNTDQIIAYLYRAGQNSPLQTLSSMSASNNWQNDDPWPSLSEGSYLVRFIPLRGNIQGISQDVAVTVGVQACSDECSTDVLRLNVGRDQNGQCSSQTRADSYICYSGDVGTRRVCGGQEYLCTDSGRNQFYWSSLGSGGPHAIRYNTTFTCNSRGTAWACTNSLPVTSCN